MPKKTKDSETRKERFRVSLAAGKDFLSDLTLQPDVTVTITHDNDPPDESTIRKALSSWTETVLRRQDELNALQEALRRSTDTHSSTNLLSLGKTLTRARTERDSVASNLSSAQNDVERLAKSIADIDSHLQQQSSDFSAEKARLEKEIASSSTYVELIERVFGVVLEPVVDGRVRGYLLDGHVTEFEFSLREHSREYVAGAIWRLIDSAKREGVKID